MKASFTTKFKCSKDAFLITTKQVMEIINFELHNQFTILGDMIFFSKLGVPMGKAASPTMNPVLNKHMHPLLNTVGKIIRCKECKKRKCKKRKCFANVFFKIWPKIQVTLLNGHNNNIMMVKWSMMEILNIWGKLLLDPCVYAIYPMLCLWDLRTTKKYSNDIFYCNKQ